MENVGKTRTNRIKIGDRLETFAVESNNEDSIDETESITNKTDPKTTDDDAEAKSDAETDTDCSFPVFDLTNKHATGENVNVSPTGGRNSGASDSDGSGAADVNSDADMIVADTCSDVDVTHRDLTTVSYADIAEDSDMTEVTAGQAHGKTETKGNQNTKVRTVRKKTSKSCTGKEHSSLSPEEKERYAFISEQLNILNKESDTTTTTSRGRSTDKKGIKPSLSRILSPLKNMSPFRKLARGIKRTKRRLPMMKMKRRRLQQSPEDKPEPRHIIYHSDDSDDSSSEDNGWTIMEESENEIDHKLENKAEAFALSAINVKSILHKIITNEGVVEMVRNAMTEDEASGEAYEPKMTRSKVKEVLETKGSVPHPWGLSPLKMPPKPGTSAAPFLDIDLPEDEEEDEDFNPDKVMHESDEDSESILSSCISDIGSPMPSTPNTPSVASSVRPDVTDSESSQTFLSPMGPPLHVVVPRSGARSSLGQKFREALADDDRKRAREEELIASRTRSKCPLTDTSLLELEANFIAPDITTDMYDTYCDDQPWQTFLQSLIKTDPVGPEATEVSDVAEEEDPEYNYLEEGEEEYDKEDFRRDRAVKVSKKEVNLLMDELYEAYSNDPLDEDSKHAIVAQAGKIRLTEKSRQHKNLVFQISDHELRQIYDQMRKHVQLLAQTYVLARSNDECEEICQHAKMYLQELATFAAGSETILPVSAYVSCNLAGAIDLVKTDEWWNNPSIGQGEINKMGEVNYKHDTLNLPPLLPSQAAVMWNSPVFSYPHMLPHGGFYKKAEMKKDRSRIKFLECEDNLLAIGLEQFAPLGKKQHYIQSFLLPSKTKEQIIIRIKNLRTKAAKSNPVKYFREHKQLPQFPRYDLHYDDSMMKAPKDQNISFDKLPSWCQVFAGGCGNSNCPHRQAASDAACGSHSHTNHASCSTHGTPQNKVACGSSGSSGRSTGSNPVTRRPKRRPYRTRKKLSMTGAAARTQGSFLPLPNVHNAGVVNQSLSLFNPITISLLDKSTTDSLHLSSNAGSYLVNSSASFPTCAVEGVAVTCVAPTIILINNITSTCTLNASTTTTPVVLTISSAEVAPQQTTKSQGAHQSLLGSSPHSDQDSLDGVPTALGKGELQFLSMPDMDTLSCGDQEMSANDSLREITGDSLILNESLDGNKNETVGRNDNLSSNGYCVTSGVNDNLNSCDGVGDLDSVDTNNVSDMFQTAGEKLDLLSSAMQVSQIPMSPDTCIVSRPQTPVSQCDLGTNGTDGIGSVPMSRSQTPVRSRSQTPVMSRSQTPVNGAETVANTCTCAHTSNKSTSMYNPQTPRPNTPTQSPYTTKSALEIVASYAPYFMPPSPATNYGDHQKLLETTPTKARYRPVAPKPPSVGKRSPGFVGGIKPPCRTSPHKSSPQRRKLQEQARSILPKGFVPRKFGSPTKKVASSLIDKAKHHGKNRSDYCNILPRPPEARSISRLASSAVPDQTARMRRLVWDNVCRKSLASLPSDAGDDEESDVVKDNASNASDYDTLDSEIEELGDDDDDDDEEDGNDNNNADQGLDTDSDVDTQSEDDIDIEMQEDGDSQDDEEHLANLMEASTTLRFDRSKDDMQRSKLDKKHRNRELTLAMLSPDLIESDPIRDERDTAFAQAYLTKVKKVLRDDLDTYEKFLRIMYEFSKTEQSPIKLYKELSLLFVKWPDLLDDFSGFLLPEQASVCGCSHSYQEFLKARSFIRKLEVYFNKAPAQFQKLMKIFSRWYRKSSRHHDDLREQIEPMLKGQTMLLEEFSRFFPDAQPPESLMDDFEEVNLDGSGEDTDDITARLDDGFEEVELPDEPDVLGTKRCPCRCHHTKDDTYRKRKKHCYQCCLTVIDGELVYKINNKTIKKVNVTFGPSITSTELSLDKDAQQGNSDPPALITQDRKPDAAVSEQFNTSQKPAETDWLTDGETAEKENIEYYRDEESEHSQDSEETTRNHPVPQKSGHSHREPRKYAWKKSSFLQRIGRLSHTSKERKKNTRLSTVLKSSGKNKKSHNQDDNPAISSADHSATKSMELPSGDGEKSNDSGRVTQPVAANINSEDYFSDKTRKENEIELFGSPSSTSTVSECSTVSESDKTSSGTLSDSSVDGLVAGKAWSASSDSPTECQSQVMEIAENDSQSLSPEEEETEVINKDKHEKMVEDEADDGVLENISNQSESGVSVETKNDIAAQRGIPAASSDSNLANEILARAFNALLFTDVSIDSVSVSETQSLGSTMTPAETISEKGTVPLKMQGKPAKDSLTKTITVVEQQDAVTGKVAFSVSPMCSPADTADTSSTASNIKHAKHSYSCNVAAAASGTLRISSPTQEKTGNPISVSLDLVTPTSQLSPEVCLSLPIIAPEGSAGLTISRNSSFSKVSSKTKICDDTCDKVLTVAPGSCTVPDDSYIPTTAEAAPESKPTPSDTTSFNQALADKQDLQKSVAPVSPFSPFSQFGQEIQNITAGKSPLTYNTHSPPDNSLASRRQSTTKLRRITPIPVKGSSLQSDGQSLSAFETVAKNSPVLFEAPVVNVLSEKHLSHAVSFENLKLQLEDSKSNGAFRVKYIRTPTPCSTELPGSGSNSLKSSETVLSQKSDGVVSSGSQQSYKSATEPISLTQPMNFSEDANEGFIKPLVATSNTGVQSSQTIISDESLFGKFVHGTAGLTENMNSISNLTNILTALNGHAMSDNQYGDSGLHSKSRTDENEAVQIPFKQPCQEYVPQSSRSIENQTRLENMDIKVSSLSDSDSNSAEKTVVTEIPSSLRKTENDCFMGQVMVSVKLSDVSIEGSSLPEKPSVKSDPGNCDDTNVDELDQSESNKVDVVLDKVSETNDSCSDIMGTTSVSDRDNKTKQQKQKKSSEYKRDRKSVRRDKSECESNTHVDHSSVMPVEKKPVQSVSQKKKTAKSLEAVVKKIRSSTRISAKENDKVSLEEMNESVKQQTSPGNCDITELNTNQKLEHSSTENKNVHKQCTDVSSKKQASKTKHKLAKSTTSCVSDGDNKTKQQKQKKSSEYKRDGKSVCRDKSERETNTHVDDSSVMPGEKKPVQSESQKKKTGKRLEAVVKKIRSSTRVSAKVNYKVFSDESNESVQQQASPGNCDTDTNQKSEHASTEKKNVHKKCTEVSSKKQATKTANTLTKKREKRNNKTNSTAMSELPKNKKKANAGAQRQLQKRDSKHAEETCEKSVRTSMPNKFHANGCDTRLETKTSSYNEDSNTTDELILLEVNVVSAKPTPVALSPVEATQTSATVLSPKEPTEAIHSPAEPTRAVLSPEDKSSPQPGTSVEVEILSSGVETKSVEESESSKSRQSVSEPVTASEEIDVEADEKEPQWTMELDRVILEGCKAYGVEDSSFARIAGEIGHVTQQQVQGRFQHLYQEILSKMFEHGSQTDN